MGLIGVWNMSFMNYSSRTTLPYAEALLKLPAHIQQLDMEVSANPHQILETTQYSSFFVPLLILTL